MSKRKVCVVVASRANYGRIKYVMKAIQAHPDLELQLIVGASTLLERFGKAIDVIRGDGFEPDRSIHYVVEGETLTTQAKSTGLGIVELSTAFADLQPDMVITVADRFETMATAIASTYLNVPLIHIQGGEVSGNIDDRVRHAITKLSEYHFVATEDSRERVVKMGEDASTVFNYGCPAMDVLVHDDLTINNDVMSKYGGVGKPTDWTKPYILMVQHPVTTSVGKGFDQVSQSLQALAEIKEIQKVVLWPNIDAGSDEVAKGIRTFRERNMDEPFHYFRNFTPEDYARVLKGASCCVGNSSSFLRECSFLGTPVVLVGDRQRGREHGRNVKFAEYKKDSILENLKAQLENRRYDQDHIFGDGNAGKKIADELTKINLNYEKQITY